MTSCNSTAVPAKLWGMFTFSKGFADNPLSFDCDIAYLKQDEAVICVYTFSETAGVQ